MSESAAEMEPASLQARLEGKDPGPVDGSSTITDPVALFRHLESSGHFHRDNGFGRIFHPGRVTFRENEPTDSLHIVIDDNRVAAHVDRVSPLGLRPQRTSRYSFRRAAAHNVAGAAHAFLQLLRGREGDHRCELHCEWIWNPAGSTPDHADLIDPDSSAWSVQLEARVSGSLDEARLRTALSAVLGLREMHHDPLEVVDCAGDVSLDAARAHLHQQVVPITEWPPLRALLARHPGGDLLMLTLNHAATDGFGAMRVLDCLARAYAGDGQCDRPLDFLAAHDLPVRPASGPASVWVRARRKVVERLRDALARPARLAPDQARDEPGYGFHLERLSAEETSRVVDVDRPGTSRNVLMAALHLAVGDWNLAHGIPGRRIGVLVPVNLRPPEWPEEKIANFSVTARVSTSRRHRANRASALKAVTAQTTRNKRSRTGIALVAALERAGLLPLWAKQSLVVLQPLTGNRLVDTAIFSNLGWLHHPPSFGADAGETVDLWYSVPARAPRALCVGAVTVGGRLHLTLRYPCRLFSSDAARRFAHCYVRRMRSVAENRSNR